DLSCQRSNEPLDLPVKLWHWEPSAAGARLAPGLQVECYEGFWEKVPDFDLLRAVRTGITTNLSLPLVTMNFNLPFRNREELVGLRLTGFAEIPKDALYTFRLGSDDGSLLFIGSREVSVTKLGMTNAPAAQAGVIGEPMSRLEERRWLSLQGRV